MYDGQTEKDEANPGMTPISSLQQNPFVIVLQLLFVLGFVSWRQLRPRPVRLLGTIITSAILLAFFSLISLGPHLRTGDAWTTLVAALPEDIFGLAIGSLLGYRFGTSMNVRFDPVKGYVRQSNWRLIAFWMGIVAFRYVVRYVNYSLNLPLAEQVSDGLLALALASVIGRNVTILIRAGKMTDHHNVPQVPTIVPAVSDAAPPLSS
jgi:hypothetical protein